MDKRPPPKALIAPHLKPMAPIPTEMQATGGLKSPVRCLLCDIYGTLFISGSGDVSLARRQRRPLPAIDQLLARYEIAIPSDKLLDRLYDAIEQHHRERRQAGVAFPEIRIEQIWKDLLGMRDDQRLRRFAIEFEMIVNPVWPMPHLTALLEGCRRARIHLGIISNAQFFTPYLFSWFLGKSPMELGFNNDLTLLSHAAGEAKPSPVLFDTAVRRLGQMGIEPGWTAYIGNDMRKDILPSHNVGFQTVLFAGDARSLRLADDQANTGTVDSGVKPDMVVTDLQQLIKHLL